MEKVFFSGDFSSLPQEVRAILERYSVEILKRPEGFSIIFENGELKLHNFKSEMNAIFIDFEKQWIKFQSDFKKAPISKEPFKKALGKCKTAIDATCGMGKDSSFMLFAGLKVHAIERSPWISILIEDAIRRIQSSKFAEIFSESFTFEHGKAQNTSVKSEIIYIDPMYPIKNDKSKPLKNMQFLRELIGNDCDSEELLHFALQNTKDRVLVKRPICAPELVSGVLHSYKGKSTRYDMYKCP